MTFPPRPGGYPWDGEDPMEPSQYRNYRRANIEYEHALRLKAQASDYVNKLEDILKKLNNRAIVNESQIRLFDFEMANLDAQKIAISQESGAFKRGLLGMGSRRPDIPYIARRVDEEGLTQKYIDTSNAREGLEKERIAIQKDQSLTQETLVQAQQIETEAGERLRNAEEVRLAKKQELESYEKNVATARARHAAEAAERTGTAREAEIHRAQLAARKETARLAEQRANQSVAIIVGGLIVIAGLAALFFTPGSPANLIDNNSKKNSSSDGNPNSENIFAVSSDYFFECSRNAGGGSSGDGWAGNSSTFYADNNTGFRNLVEQAAATSQDVDATVQIQAGQVSDGRNALANTFDGLQLAMPVSESLYSCGPAGPALSYHFQLAVTTAAVSTGTDTTNKMSENSKKHGERLSALARQYDEAFSAMPPLNTTSPG